MKCMNNLHYIYIYVHAIYAHTESYIYISTILENMFQKMFLIIISNILKNSGKVEKNPQVSTSGIILHED